MGSALRRKREATRQNTSNGAELKQIRNDKYG